MKNLLILLALLPALLIGQTTNTKLSQNLLLEVLSGQNALTGANLVTNGGFDVNPSATWTESGGSWNWNSAGYMNQSGNASANFGQDMGFVEGKTYLLSYTVPGYASGYVRASVTSGYIEPERTAAGSYQTMFKCPSTNGWLYINSVIGSHLDVDNIVVREVNQYALTSPDPSYTFTNTGAIPTYGHKGNNSYYAFDGVDDLVTHAFTTPVSSFVIWIYPTVTNKLWINMGTNMTIGIDGSNDLALGSALTNPTTYIFDGNGDAKASVTLNAWNYIVIKSDEITPTTLQFGYVSASYGTFNLNGVQLFNYGVNADTAAYYSDKSNHLKAADNDGSGNECVLSLTAEGMLGSTTQGIWRDYYHSTDIPLSGETAPRLVRSWSGMNSWRMTGDDYLSKSSASDGLTGDITISCWVFNTAWAPTYGNRIFNNGKIDYYIDTDGVIRISRDDATTSSFGALALNTWYHLVITSTSSGITDSYINGVLTGVANQSAGTPAIGTNYIVGKHTNALGYMNGVIEGLKITKGIWSTEQIALDFSSFQD